MQSKANTPNEYIESLPDERKKAIEKIRSILLKNLPNGFAETMSYGMLGYVVPHEIYPNGYHVDPGLPLPFISLASQKNYIALYHFGIYTDMKLLEWFRKEYSKQVDTRLDMGKSCIRFKSVDKIPYGLIEELAKKMTPQDWIRIYEKSVKR